MIGDSFDGSDASGLEQTLRDRMGSEPSAALRERVMAGVERALAERAAGVASRGRAGAGVARWAAVLLIGLTLSQVAASATPFFRPPSPFTSSAVNGRAVAALLREVAPDLSADDADRMTIACLSRRDLVPIPSVAGGSDAAGLPGDARLTSIGDLR